MLLSIAWEGYQKDKLLLGYSKHTIKAYTVQIRLFQRHFGDIPIGEITYEQLKEYLTKDITRLKPASIGHRIRFIKSFFRWAIDEGITLMNPAAKLREPKQGIRIPKAMTEEDIELLREECRSPLEHVIIDLLYTTGCRVGEIVGINRNQINWENRSIIVTGKGNKQREVYFTIRCAIWLKRYLKERSDTDMALIVTERAPHRMSIAQIRYIIKRIAKRAGITESVYPHKMRHTFATTLLNNGMPMEMIQSLLGHSKIETTKLYANLSGPIRREYYQKYFK